ncbi:pro-resilin isoform X1 [Plutella xylostella]|uniref:pro-resilin isoform X1 n=1 Tax=Plutella xylostella TaxID=51655 RepID=UPI0005D0B253|nr:pro-resilin isoform X1 [Plutella xylostella]
MKTFVACAAMLAVAMAEPPPSNSYLPPSPNQRSAGYTNGGYPSPNSAAAGPAGLPQVLAARSNQNGFARNGQGFGSQGAPSQGYDQNAGAFARNALEQQNQEPANYNFEYMVSDYDQGTEFGHHEERENESARGEYSVVLPDGRRQTVTYEADERGFKPRISYEETDNFARSAGGYDANANNRIEQNGVGNHGNGIHNGGRGY